MEYVKIEGQFPKFSHCAVTLGKFDGIHRGHRKLIQTILNRKKEYGELAVVMAFVSDRQTILTSEERRILLEKMGVDILLECPLNDQIKHMKADVFIRQILKGDLQASCVVVGEDFRFGHERKGSPELLEKYGEKYDYETIVIVKEMEGNRKISSTYIREELKKGNMEKIAEEYGIHINRKKTRIVKISSTYKFLQIKYSLTDSGKVIKRINPKRVTAMRRKLKRLAVKVKNEEISYENVENMFRSWMGGFYKLLSKEQRKNLIGLYEDLFEKSIEIVNKKMIIVDKTR